MTRHLRPTNDAFIPGVPAVEQDVDDEEAERLLSFFPPAFTEAPQAAETPAGAPEITQE